MFQQEGEHRSDRHNQLLAGYLALVAGTVNSVGFILIGSYTSHVTGNVGRMADDVALGQSEAALLAATMVAAFFVGAFVASMAIESTLLRRRPQLYGTLLLGEASLLGSFFALSWLADPAHPRSNDTMALLLCIAMGLQNSLVTRLSGAVVRTTHLTGVVTDLGIEGARWFRYWRAVVGDRMGVKLTFGAAAPTRPHGPKGVLLLTIFHSFVVGSASGALLAVHLRQLAVLWPTLLLLGGGLFAFVSGRELEVPEVRK